MKVEEQTVEAFHVPMHIDLSVYLQVLEKRQIPARVLEINGYQSIIVPSKDAFSAKQIYQELNLVAFRRKANNKSVNITNISSELINYLYIFKCTPCTFSIVILALITYIVQSFVNMWVLTNFTFNYYDIMSGEVYRLITPIFLHFGIIHLVFNCLMFYEFASRVELVQGALSLLLTILAIAIFSNMAQFYISGPLFGGLSGVVYGLFSHVVVSYYFTKNKILFLQKHLMYWMLIWLAFGMLPIFSIFNISIANVAHFSGLAMGVFTSVIANFIYGEKRAN